MLISKNSFVSRYLGVIVLIAGFCAASARAETAITPAMTPMALKVLAIKQNITGSMGACRKDFSEHAPVFDFFEHIWTMGNHVDLNIAELIWRQLPEKDRSVQVKKWAASEHEFLVAHRDKNMDSKFEYCKGMMASINSQQMNIDKLLPAESQVMHRLFSERHSNKNFVRDNDMTIGCIKGFYNQGSRDLAAAKTLCDCSTKTLLSMGTSAEIDEWLATEDKSVLLSKPWAQGLVEKLQDCKLLVASD